MKIDLQELRHDKVLQHDQVRAGSRIYFAHSNVDIHVCARAFARVCRRRARFMPPFAEVYLGMAARFRG